MLETILDATRARLPDVRQQRSGYQAAVAAMPRALDFAVALSAPGLSVIAEIKRRSPSAGAISLDIDPPRQATEYVAGGASAISVLTEPDFFGGSLEDLAAVRAAVDVPILRKDFVIDEAQIWQARAYGADAILLIVAALTTDELRHLLEVADSAGVAALVEVHTASEAETAAAVGASVVGVNNRDLKTFVTDLATAETLYPLVAGAQVKVGESGVSDPIGAARMRSAGYDAILVGEALVRAADPAALVAELRSA
ncbi:MAG: indole-3-glycerol phosphate synthase TrpC [Acidimicrobiia bacterium]|nr:indole-3-glycerol phosphate synthase TrpC [Acidimicrobiia bacterium]